jgi:hypothetical protein
MITSLLGGFCPGPFDQGAFVLFPDCHKLSNTNVYKYLRTTMNIKIYITLIILQVKINMLHTIVQVYLKVSHSK